MGPDCEKNNETEKERARQTQRETREKRGGWTNGLYKSEADSRREFSVFLLTSIAPGLASLCLCASTFTALYKV